MAESEEFQRAKTCYEQNCQQMRSLNQIMWQVPIIAMGLTGGLWFAVGTIKGMDNVARGALLIFAGLANIGLAMMINRVRDVIDAHLEKMKGFSVAGYVDASSKNRSFFFKNRGVCRTFTVLMLVAAAFSFAAVLLILCGWAPVHA